MGKYVMLAKATISREHVNFVEAQENAHIARVNTQHASVVMAQVNVFN